MGVHAGGSRMLTSQPNEEHNVNTADSAERTTFLDAYLECARWSSSVWDGDDESRAAEDFDMAPEAIEELEVEALQFIDGEADLLSDVRIEAGQAGHDFWLTRNGHGAGFWDRGLGELGDKLTKACRPYGERDLYLGDDDLLHV